MVHVKPTSGGEGEPRKAAARTRRSLVIPIYRNEENIADLLAALAGDNDNADGMEVVFVVDGSPDRSGEFLLAARGQMPFSSTIAFHSRNFGSFTAIRTGLELAKGASIAVMAADLQEPPELIVRFFRTLENDEADVVFGQRAGRLDSMVRDALSGAFWWLCRKLVIRDIPEGGVNIIACNRTVRDAVLDRTEQFADRPALLGRFPAHIRPLRATTTSQGQERVELLAPAGSSAADTA